MGQSFWQWWLEMVDRASRIHRGKEELVMAAILLWMIWRARNTKIFDSQDTSSQQTLTQAMELHTA
ncbi:hypothetical protein PIB30_093156, partial [Stylosanthes scabra]|nr:hypothetical protein [Stylosanthes scabra]